MSAQYNRKDYLYKKAKEEGYRSRAAYKLIELDKKYRFLKKGAKVVDLGCFPGGWLQVSLEKVGSRGLVIGVDLQKVQPVEIDARAAVIFCSDAASSDTIAVIKKVLSEEADVLLSDMSPALSGIRFQDALRSAELVEVALSAAKELLKQGGTLIAKIFPGSESDKLAKIFKEEFEVFNRVNLSSSRKTSTEFYFVAQGYKKLRKT